MKEITADKDLIAYCGLYCGACRSYLKGKCPGCLKNDNNKWCQIRVCCIKNNYKSCADCKEFPEVMECKKFNNIISKIFALVFRSNRCMCIEYIKKHGREDYAKKMASDKKQSM